MTKSALILDRDAHGSSLRAADTGAKSLPDYRKYAGAEREALREFCFSINEGAGNFSVRADSFFDAGKPAAGSAIGSAKNKLKSGFVLRDPSEKLLEAALEAHILVDSKGETIIRAEGIYRCAISLKDKQTGFEAEFILIDEDGETIPAKFFYMVNSSDALCKNKLCAVQNIGRYWKNTDVFFQFVKKEHITSYLSLMFSRFSNLSLCYEDWQIKKSRPLAAQPALLFMEIDKYEYLHVRPIFYLRDFPPLFLENEEIVTAIKMDEAEKIFYVSEIMFPDSSEALFRAALIKFEKKSEKKIEVKKYVYEEKGRFIIAPDFAKQFFSESIFELSAHFVLLETKILAGYKVSFSKPRVKLSLSSGIDFLSGNADIEFEGESFSFADFMNEYKKASFITLADGTKSFPDKRTMDKLDRLLSSLKGEAVELSLFDIPLLLNDDSFEMSGEAWNNARLFFENYNSIDKRQGIWGLQNGTLRPYQLYGVRWLDYLMEHSMGACLADEMGLGKTIQVIALLRAAAAAASTGAKAAGAQKESGICLILCPKSVVYNWASELDTFAPDLNYIVHYGTERDIEDIGEKSKSLKNKVLIVLSTYATLRRDIEEFSKLEFLYTILDESQNIKNLTTQTTAAVLSLKAKHKIAISGTPVENNLLDLYSLFRFLNPHFFGSQKMFISKYLKPVQEDNDEDALRDLKARIYPFILRRLKRDVLRDLPPKTEETAFIDLDKKQLDIYHKKRLEYKSLISGIIKSGAFAKSSIFIFKAFSELRRLASVPEVEGGYEGPSAKRLYLIEQITNLVENGHKCLVFANFLAGVELVSYDLAERGIGNITMTGATGNRQALVKSFQNDPDLKVFIMTLKTGGTGINLTAADYIFIMDPWWNSAAESQAIDRSHRIGQSHPVFCYRLIAKGTIEERILELQKRKQDLAGALLSDEASALKRLSEEDISYLIGE